MNNLIWVEGVDGCQNCVIKKMCDKDTALKTEIFGSCSAVKGTYQISIVLPEKTQEHSMQDIKLKFFLKAHGGRCNDCVLDYDECSTECGDRGFFKIKTGSPGKIQSEIEWKLERLALLKIRPSESSNYTDDEIEILAKEELELIEWLKENRPEDWQICTVKNTEKGDKIRFKGNPNLRLVEHVYESKDGIVLYNFEANTSYPITNLSKYEINLAEKE